jgi:glycosyltransferase involved in cell wall biosynthesis
MKRVLIITYYWPPSGGAGVQRWLKFVKYLPSYGWHPIVYTPLNPEMPVRDETLVSEIPATVTVLKRPISEPYRFYKWLAGRKENISTGFLSETKTRGWKEKLSVWIRGNLFIPDARQWWIKPSVNFLTGWLADNQTDVIVSTGPPHSMHLIALEVKQKAGVTWLADFRDPWTGIDFYNELMLTKAADRKHRQMEKQVLQTANAVVAISHHLRSELINKSQLTDHSHFYVIPNGYDPADFESEAPQVSVRFRLVHAGTLVRTRNPHTLWNVLADLINHQPGLKDDLEIMLAGQVDFSVMESIRQYGLESFLNRPGYLTHRQVIECIRTAQVLLLVLNDAPNAKGILTGKLFEYLAAGRPILCIGPEEGEAAQIISHCKAGITAGFQNKTRIKQAISDFYHQFKTGGKTQCRSTGVEEYSRKNLTGKLVSVLERIVR